MITIKRAVDIVKENAPESIPQAVYDYKGDYYMVVAPVNGKEDFNAPFYIVKKSNGDIRPLSPFEDPDAFGRAMHGEALMRMA